MRKMRAARSTPGRTRFVSKHGGRQLDGAPSSIRMLPTVAKAIIGQMEVWVDGGIRSGQDVLRAIGLGAKGTMIGRSFLYGLGAMGEAGVRLCLEIIAKELSATMGLCGVVDIKAVSSTVLIAPALLPRMTGDAGVVWG